jgi:hypothetical protein
VRIVDAATAPWEPYAGQRGKGTEYKHLFEGDEASSDNFEMWIIRFAEDSEYYAPRHRHNFDQFRWPLNGGINYAPHLDIEPGQLGYFPEGACYGPQEIPVGREFIVVQFAGANGDGYMGAAETDRGVKELSEHGEFKRGIYHGVYPDGRPYNKDAHQAVWEHVNGRELKFARPRYLAPIIMDPSGMQWRTINGQPGTSAKPLGTFTERGVGARLLRIQSAAQLSITPKPQVQLGFVLSGHVEIDSHAGGPQTAFELKADESMVISAASEAEVLVMSLPSFRGVTVG